MRDGMAASGPRAGHRLMREVNRALVVDLLRDGGSMSRIEIVSRTGLSKPTVSAIVVGLLQEGLITTLGPAGSRPQGGRPAELLQYNRRASAYCGVHFGVHATHVAVADALGRIVIEDQLPSTPGDFDASLQALKRFMRSISRQNPDSPGQVAGLGVAVPGPVTPRGHLELAPNLGWRDIPIRRLMEKSFRVPVEVRNIKDTAAIAEGKTGAARGLSNYVWIYAGTGIGAGIVIDGALFSGADGFAGEIGHCPASVDSRRICSCGRRGCVEALANSTAIIDSIRERLAAGGRSSLSGKELSIGAVTAAAQSGDRLATGVLRESGEHLGRGISYLLNLVNPQAVVVGGPLLAEGEGPYLAAAREAAHRHSLGSNGTPIIASSLGARGTLVGSVLVAMEGALARQRAALGMTA
jgi:N-acetylglucosamine repressor